MSSSEIDMKLDFFVCLYGIRSCLQYIHRLYVWMYEFKRGGGALHSLVSLHRAHRAHSQPPDDGLLGPGPFVMNQVRRGVEGDEIGREARRGESFDFGPWMISCVFVFRPPDTNHLA